MLNSITLIGRVGRDVEVKTLQNGNVVANFSLATSEKYTDKATGEKKEITDWHSLTIWGPLASVAEKYLKKGDLAYFQGKSRTRSYDDANGVKKYVTEVIVNDMKMLGGGSKPESQVPSAHAQGQTMGPVGGTGGSSEDDLPF